jgi:hypothetical protein
MDDYYFDAVVWAFNADPQITDGTSATTFSPDSACKNCDILTFLYRAIGEPGKTGAEPWYSDAYRWASECCLLMGTYTGSFDIEAECPRCNVVEYLYRYMQLVGAAG